MLIIDTASRRVCIAVIAQDSCLAVRSSEDEATLSLFPLVKDCLRQAKLKLEDLAAISFCEGPGSMLGIRSATMGIRTWKSAGFLKDCRILSFNSLEIGRLIILQSTQQPFLVVSDARRSSWNLLDSQSPLGSPSSLIENDALEGQSTPIFSFQEFPSWTKCSAPIERIGYRPESVLEHDAFADILRPNPNADIAVTRPQKFAKWVPQARTGDRIAP